MNATTGITVEWTLNVAQMARTPKEEPESADACLERIPRLARLMALAIRFDDLICQGIVRDYADLARLGHVSRARITQIMSLLLLAPDIQEALLFLSHRAGPKSTTLTERHVRPVCNALDWAEQRRRWNSYVEGNFATGRSRRGHPLTLKAGRGLLQNNPAFSAVDRA